MEEGYKKINRMMTTKEYELDYKSANLYNIFLNNGGLCISLHSLMYELTVRYLADDDQVREWLPKILKL